MQKLFVSLNKTEGKIKALNGVNNGPAGSRVRGIHDFDLYKQLEIPYARNHDASFWDGYGGEHTVDVHRIFKNFDADENDPKSYFFAPTDKYNKDIDSVGTKIFYRLGASIEHNTHFGTIPPKDFQKWARICEHIIRHYTEGWAEGFHYDIQYWEIWNEADNIMNDGSWGPCWRGEPELFMEFYTVVAKYLKGKFPKLKIGGPAMATVTGHSDFLKKFLDTVKRENVPIDFFSYHIYCTKTEVFLRHVETVRNALAEYGLSDIETIINEWNYVFGWKGEVFINTVKTQRNLKGAAFVLSVMCLSQQNKVDQLMYYDARPCKFNGLFDEFYYPLKTYYSFAMFRDLRKLGTQLKITAQNENIYACAATDGKESGIILTHYYENGIENEESRVEEVSITLADIPKNGAKIEYYVTDENRDMQLIRSEKVVSNEATAYLTLPLFTSYYIRILPV